MAGNFFQHMKERLLRPFRNIIASAQASRDARRYRAEQRKARRRSTAEGSKATPYAKHGKRSRPMKPFAGMTTELRKVEGKKRSVRFRVLAFTDSTPNRHTFARFTDPKRRPKIKFLNKMTGRFDYLPQYKES